MKRSRFDPAAMNRRDALKRMTVAAAASAVAAPSALAADDAEDVIAVDPRPKFELSPYLYMQFMEPLGATDSSVEAAWNHARDCWREDVVEATRELAPTMLRWGGCFSSYYRWHEGVGPREQRRPMVNILWGGMESNQVGTAEFVDFARQVGAEPLMSVNFQSDGRKKWMRLKDSVRTADAQEAAQWVAYCNQPGHAERSSHGMAQPLGIKYWQIGNETSYDKSGFDVETAARKTVEFAKAMRRADPSIRLIAWGDSGWAERMLDVAGEHIQMLAFHHMFNPDREKVIEGEGYRRDPAATWEILMDAWKIHDDKIVKIREGLAGRAFPLAMTECHYSFRGRNRNEVMSTWATGVSYGRILNCHQRHGDVLKIATAADFCGTRWQVNALMIPVPGGKAYLMPVARVMQLYRKHSGTHAVAVKRAPDGLDVVASRSGNTIFLNVVNTRRERAVRTHFRVDGSTVASGRTHQIADDPTVEVSELNSDRVVQVRQRSLPADASWEFPAASVSAIELTLS